MVLGVWLYVWWLLRFQSTAVHTSQALRQKFQFGCPNLKSGCANILMQCDAKGIIAIAKQLPILAEIQGAHLTGTLWELGGNALCPLGNFVL